MGKNELPKIELSPKRKQVQGRVVYNSLTDTVILVNTHVVMVIHTNMPARPLEGEIGKHCEIIGFL